jgi:DNA topoisomerase-2
MRTGQREGAPKTRLRQRYRDFVNKELVLFSVADNQRSIPSVVDGLKPSQRKVLFACFKRKLRKEIKVAQLAGYISEHAAYHHGEMSLTGTIVGMAQDFVGSNNVNLLTPAGQFGTRIMGGKDAASSRYIFTKLEAVARKVFHPDDDAVLDYLEDDGQSIEPAYYVPVVPFALCNGADGIGTGWATTVPNYAPKALIGVMRRMITVVGGDVDGALSELTAIECGADDLAPAYRGFAGAIAPKAAAGTFAVSGNCTRTGDATVLVDELPVRKWTHDYKLWLEAQLTGDDKTSARPRGCFSLFLWTAPLLPRAGPRGSRTSRRTTRIRRCRSRSRSPTARSSTRPRRRSAASTKSSSSSRPWRRVT